MTPALPNFQSQSDVSCASPTHMPRVRPSWLSTTPPAFWAPPWPDTRHLKQGGLWKVRVFTDLSAPPYPQLQSSFGTVPFQQSMTLQIREEIFQIPYSLVGRNPNSNPAFTCLNLNIHILNLNIHIFLTCYLIISQHPPFSQLFSHSIPLFSMFRRYPLII